MTAHRVLMIDRPGMLDGPCDPLHTVAMTVSFDLPSVDPLGEALHSLRMSGAFYCRSELSAPWGVAIPAMDSCLAFHFIAAGRCRLEVPGATARELRAGDLVLVP